MKKTGFKLFLSITTVFVIMTSVISCAGAGAGNNDSDFSKQREGSFYQSDAKNMLTMVNNFRTGNEANYVEQNGTTTKVEGLANLSWDNDLEKIAKARAKEISVKYAHTRPDGSSCFTIYTEYGISKGGWCGENIAVGYSTTEAMFNGWKEDGEPYSGQGHRRNMLSKNAKRIAVACFVPSEDIDPSQYPGVWPSSGKTKGYRYWVMVLAG